MEYDKSLGSPYDRGSADAYYHRGCLPHLYNPKRIEKEDMTPDEIAAYYAGYEEETGSKF